ncbi:MAG: hypothetical protein ACYTKD_13745 [Planctomycetota bacterium]|jgi:hypothetical protein
MGGLSVLVVVPALAAGAAQPSFEHEMFYGTVLRVDLATGEARGVRTTYEPKEEITVRVEVLDDSPEESKTFVPGRNIVIPVRDAGKVLSGGRVEGRAAPSPIGRTFHFGCSFQGEGADRALAIVSASCRYAYHPPGRTTPAGESPVPPRERMPYQAGAYRRSETRLGLLPTSVMALDRKGDFILVGRDGRSNHFVGVYDPKRERLTVVARGRGMQARDIGLSGEDVVYLACEMENGLLGACRLRRTSTATGRTEIIAEYKGNVVPFAVTAGGDVVRPMPGRTTHVLRMTSGEAEELTIRRLCLKFTAGTNGIGYAAHQRRENGKWIFDLSRYSPGGEEEPLIVGVDQDIMDLAVDSRGNIYLLLKERDDPRSGHLVVFVPDSKRPRVVALCEADGGKWIQLLSDKSVLLFRGFSVVTRLDLRRNVESLPAGPVSMLRGGRFAE